MLLKTGEKNIYKALHVLTAKVKHYNTFIDISRFPV